MIGGHIHWRGNVEPHLSRSVTGEVKGEGQCIGARTERAGLC